MLASRLEPNHPPHIKDLSLFEFLEFEPIGAVSVVVFDVDSKERAEYFSSNFTAWLSFCKRPGRSSQCAQGWTSKVLVWA